MEDKDVLPFLNTLSPDQAKFADLIITEAEKKGVPPRFALALAWQESKLNPQAMGSKDEVGIMQVRPGTAQMYGYDPKELADPTRNIRIGVDILRRHLDSFNNDPMLAAIAYNAGPNLAYLTDPQKGQLPESTEAYVRDIYKLGGFTDMPAQGAQEEETKAKEQNLMEEFVSKFQDPEAKAQALTDLMAAGAGATVSKLADVGKEGMGAARDVRAILAAQANAARAGAGTPPAPIPTDPMHTRMTQGTIDGGATGRQRERAFNIATAQQAAAKDMQEDIIKQLQRQGIVSESGRDVLAKMPGQTVTPQGVVISASQVYDDIPPPQGVAPRTPPPKPSLMQRTGQTTRNIVGGLGRAATVPFRSPVIAGALGGMGAWESGMEAQRRMKDNDMVGAGIAAAGLGGGLAALYPNPIVRSAGLITAAASPTAMYLYDKAKKAREEGAGLKPPSIYAPMYLR